jgi:cell division protease FtsH
MGLKRQQKDRASGSVPVRRVPPPDARPGGQGPGQATMPPRKTWLWFVVVIVANFLLVRLLLPGPEGPITVPYTLFKEEVRKGNVQAIHSQGDTITGRFTRLPPAPPLPSGVTAAPREGAGP